MHKHGRWIVGLAAVLSLMAFASAAHAEDETKAVSWLLSGTKLGAAETITGAQIGESEIKIPAKNAVIKCKEGVVTEGKIENEVGGAHGHLTRLYLFCSVFNTKGEELKKCTEELNNGTLAEQHITIKVLLLALLWKLPPNGPSHLIISLSPLTGTTFTTLTFGGTCALPEEVAISGTVAFEIPSEDLVKQVGKVDTENATKGLPGGKEIQELVGAKLKFGASEAFVKGEGFAELTGVNKGKAWGAM